MTNKFWLINLILFQLAWFCCALFTAQASWILPIIIAFHFTLSPVRKNDAKLLPFALLGAAFDFLLFQLDIINFQLSKFPLWLICLWALFVISVNHSLSWLNKCRPWLIALIGALGGASSYVAAIKFGAIIANFNLIFISLIYVFIWALLLPMLIVFQNRVVGNSIH